MATGGPQGFVVDMELVKAYHALNKDRKESYITMKLSADGKKVVIDEKGPAKKKAAKSYAEKNKHWDDLGAKLPEDDIRYVIIQCDYKDSKGAPQNEIIFVSWVPEAVNIMRQMEVDKEKTAIMRCLNGLRADYKATTKDNFKVARVVQEKLKGTLD